MQGVYVFYLQLLTDMLHLCVYLVFFVIVLTNYGLPQHLVSHDTSLITLLSLLCLFGENNGCNDWLSTNALLCKGCLKCAVTLLMQVRDLYWTFRNFRNRVADFLRYRCALRSLYLSVLNFEPSSNSQQQSTPKKSHLAIPQISVPATAFGCRVLCLIA